MTANPNWPVMDYAICWTASRTVSPLTQDDWCSIGARTEGSVSVTRGKTYELDQVQPGEMTVTLRNDDGAFDPANTASPFYPQVKPYRLMRVRAQWPQTVNILTPGQATAGQSDGVGPGGVLPDNVYATVTNGDVPLETVTIATYESVQAYEVAGENPGIVISGWSVIPGQTYTCSADFDVPTSHIAGSPRINWYDASGALITTTIGASTSFGVSVTGTAPNNASGARLSISPDALNTTCYVWNVQVELGSAATGWVQPGVWYPIFTGYVERWPQSWTSGGNYGVSNLTVVDLFSWLSSVPLQDPFIADLLALNPNFLYPLNEASGTTQFVEATGKRGNGTILLSTADTINPGTSLSSGDNAPQGDPDALTGAFLGSPGPATTFNTYPGGSTLTTHGATIVVPPDPVTGLCGPPVSGAFTRVIAARATGYPPDGAMVMYGYVDALGENFLDSSLNDSGFIPAPGSGNISSFTTNETKYPTVGAVGAGTKITDTDWHLYGMSLSADGKTLTSWSDNSLTHNTYTFASSARPESLPPNMATDIIGANWAGDGSNAQWVGDLAFYFELPTAMDAATWGQIYQSWRNAWSYGPHNLDETSGARYKRILAWLGFPGVSRISGGDSLQYGPATDIVGGVSPTLGLDALQSVVDTEAGEHFVSADGVVVFQARSARYNQTPTVTFGEQAGEVPYLGAQFDFDPTRVANAVQVTQQYGNVVYSVQDEPSQNDYGQIGLQRTVNSMDPGEIQDAAEYLLYQYKQPGGRLEALPVDVGSNPAVWPLLLGLELGAAVEVNRRPSNAPAITMQGFVEQVVWTLGDDGSASWTAQISNSALHDFAEFDSATYGLFDSTLIFGY